MFISLAEHLKPVRALNKPHKGVVVDNNDPLKLNRVKVRIDGLLEAPTADLPWVNTKSNPRFTNIPEIGDELFIEFPFQNIYFPFYDGYWNNDTNKISDFDTNYPNTYGFVDSIGNKYLVDKTAGTIQVLHKSGSAVNIADNGDFVISSVNDIVSNATNNNDLIAGVDVNIASGGNTDITAGGNIDMQASLMNLKATLINLGDSPTEPAVLFNALKTVLESFIDLVAAHTHAGMTIPPPDNAAAITAVKATINTAMSAKVKLE